MAHPEPPPPQTPGGPAADGRRPLAGRAAVITGGGGGIGRAVVEELARRGAAVVAVDTDPQVTALPPPDDGSTVRTVHGDLREAATADAVWRAVDLTGAIPHILVNTAFSEVRGELLHLADTAWQDTYEVSVGVAARLTADFGRRLAGRPGSVVNIASVHAFGASSGTAPYDAAKAALVALTRSTAVELGPLGIRCNAVAPGFVRVPRNRHMWQDEEWTARLATLYPLRRVGEPADIARAVAFLASDDAAFVTGTCLVVDCGYTAQLPAEAARP
jgi:NAD(P)-dependent dehydrogenase (short-subunit alcohol dehydrogenase family)